MQNLPNNGNLQTIGQLGVNFTPVVEFDIFTDTKSNNTGYVLSGSALYNINLSTGGASKITNAPKGNFIGLAVTSQ